MNKAVLKHPVIIGSIALLVFIAGGSYWYYAANIKAPAYVYTAVQRGSIVQEVTATGQVSAAQNSDLGFERGGKIVAVNVVAGQRVGQGQALIQLFNADLAAQLDQAKASIKAQQARLDQMKGGARKEEVELKQSQLQKAQQDLANIYASAPDALKDSVTKASYAVSGQTDVFFDNAETTSPTFNYTVTNSQAKIDVVAQRVVVNNELSTWKSELAVLSTASFPADIDVAITKAQAHLSVIRTYLNRTMDAVTSAVGPTQASVDANKAIVNGALASVNAIIASVNAQQQAIASQQVVVKTYQDQLNLTMAGNTSQEIDAQQAQVDAAVATMKGVQAQIAKTYIVAPFAGTVSKVSAKVGEIALPNVSVVSLLSDNHFQIDSNIPEADIAKVHMGDSANVTLDAYGTGVVFNAIVGTIDPGQTIVNNIPTYKVTLQFTKEDPRVKIGMTANIDMITGKADNAVLVAKNAIVRRDNKEFVVVSSANGKSEDREIQTGIEGANGMIEVIAGLREGDKVANFGTK